ncbi:MAG TPA: biotin/lipoyl-containing protein [Pirellulales bacterium]|nr:biotin/lipoyl-containing protein [Pirellulales bacterium]
MRHELVLPDLGVDEVTVSLWLVEVGSAVIEGDRLLEVLADGVSVDLPSPASGTLTELLVAEDDPLTVAQVLGVIESPDGDASV